MTPGEKVAQQAEKYIGVRENPMGSNRGRPYPEKWQQPWGMGTGWPWCAAFADAIFKEAGVSDDGIGHPSTAVMYQRAKEKGAIVKRPMVGCYILWPGVHVGIVVRVYANGTVLAVEGNSGDGVRYRTRSGDGVVWVAPREIRTGNNPAAPDRDYFLEDVNVPAPRLVGPWRTRNARERVLKKVKGHIRRVRVGKKYGAYVGPPKIYGPWATAAQRNSARKILEDRLGRTLRPYSRPSKSAPAGKPDALGKTT
jgi:hypothetical protein